jgi:hypothetical protein
MTVVRMTSLFAGLPALLTSGGIGRLAAHESMTRRRRGAIGHAAGVHALAGMLLTLIAALPHGHLPGTPAAWAALGALGALAGALCGLVIGVACTGAPPRQVTEMLSLVKRPGLTLRQLIESEDLGRIGAAVRHRASLMFDGLLDPAEPRPADDGTDQRAASEEREAEPPERGSAGPAGARAAIAPAGEEVEVERAAARHATASGRPTDGPGTGDELVATAGPTAGAGGEGERRGTGEPRA